MVELCPPIDMDGQPLEKLIANPGAIWIRSRNLKLIWNRPAVRCRFLNTAPWRSFRECFKLEGKIFSNYGLHYFSRHVKGGLLLECFPESRTKNTDSPNASGTHGFVSGHTKAWYEPDAAV